MRVPRLSAGVPRGIAEEYGLAQTGSPRRHRSPRGAARFGECYRPT